LDEARRAVQRCGLRWDDAVLQQVYDPDCRHHEASAVLHPAQQAFDELCGPGGGAADPEGCPAVPDPWQMLDAAAAREDFFQQRVISLQQQLAALRRESSRQIEQLQAEIRRAQYDLVVLGEELALMKGSRTWRLRESLLATARRAGLASLRR
jgi:hypothetical protein